MPVGKKIETPCFLIDVNKVKQKYQTFKKAITDCNRNDIIAYSIKANYDKNIVTMLDNSGAFFEVCSEFELSKLQEYNIELNKIVINGFIENKNMVLEYINGGALVIVGSDYDLQWVNSINFPVDIGIRINLDYIKKDCNLYSCKRSRFGIDIRNNVLFDLILKNKNINVICLHCHFSGNTRDPVIYADIVNELCEIINKYKLKHVKIIDIGGGYKVGPKFWSFADYVNNIVAALKSRNMEKLKVIYEPGNSVVGNSCSYITKIIDVKSIHGLTYVTVDGTSIHLFPRQGKRLLDYRIPLRKGETEEKQIIVGNTCKESDVILEINNSRKLEIGETLRFDNLGAYLLNEIPAFLLEYPSVYYVDIVDRIQPIYNFEIAE